MCPHNLYRGPWSEWSTTTEWRTTGTNVEDEGLGEYLWVSYLGIIPLIVFLLLVYLKRTFLQKKLQLITFIPRPNEFFKPLYHNYEGNFKEWVKPVFSEYDYLRVNSHVQTMSEKQHDILQWNNEKQSYSDDIETKEGGHLLHMLQPHNNLLLHFQNGSSSQGTSHSMGHISIHTVTLSGEEGEDEVMSQGSINTLRSYQNGESFGSFEEDNREHAGYDLEAPQLSRMDRQSGILPQHENQISNELSVENINFQPHAQFNEPERLSLDSFASNEQSEDGYPHVDLDTIDSGFVECSSPGASDSNTGEQMECDLFYDHKNSNSNYVKQWMICNTIQEDSSNSENELHEMQ
ncbi:interleukin-21 receptor-like protein [Lates japonicus]|uniref:Interleukin-21 receptor-like protein n=1 Tax=Lates japonicus TaxID=270547 RepID=A0AAD3R0W7_LATJO|nr:interleukin-21 receptor-like protein [Lates japonicus]